jgi:hypothetical protein
LTTDESQAGGATDAPPPRDAAAPLALGALFDITLRVLRRRLVTLLLLAAAFQAPGAIITAVATASLGDVLADVMPMDAAGRPDPTAQLAPAAAARLLEAGGLLLLVSAVAGLVAALGTLAIAHVVTSDRAGRGAGFGEALRVALRRAPVAIGAIAVTTLITVALAVGALLAAGTVLAVLPVGPGGGPGAFVAILLGVAFVFALVWLSLRWAMLLPVAALEGGGVTSVLRRSWHLTGGHMLRTLAVLVVAAIVTAVISALLAQLLGIALVDPLAGDPTQGRAAETLVSAIAQIAVAPVAPVLVVVLYHDLVNRHAAAPPSRRGA